MGGLVVAQVYIALPPVIVGKRISGVKLDCQVVGDTPIHIRVLGQISELCAHRLAHLDKVSVVGDRLVVLVQFGIDLAAGVVGAGIEWVELDRVYRVVGAALQIAELGAGASALTVELGQLRLEGDRLIILQRLLVVVVDAVVEHAPVKVGLPKRGGMLDGKVKVGQPRIHLTAAIQSSPRLK